MIHRPVLPPRAGYIEAVDGNGVHYYRKIITPEAEQVDERVTALEESLAETDEAAIELYEATLAQEAVNAEQDEAIIEIYEMLGGE